MPTTTRKKIPAAACQLRSGPLELAAAESDAPPVARILARSGQSIQHWYWGHLVHDLAGMQILKDRVPLDYCHDAGEILGYAEDWNAETGDLVCSGTLLPEQSERAAEIVQLARAGVPYEASITFQPESIEELFEGQSATVNGRLVDGPAAIVRRWQLRGLAVCPRGADPNTRTELGDHAGEVDVTILTNPKEATMPAAKPDVSAETLTKTPDEIRAELRAEHAEFSAKHGAELAAKWGPLGECELSMDSVAAHVQAIRTAQAAELTAAKATHDAALAELQGKLTAAEAQATELQARIAAIGLGETDPASSTPAEAASQLSASEQAQLSVGMRKFVGAMRAARTKMQAAASK